MLFVRLKVNSRWEKSLKQVTYYGFVALSLDKEIRIKVIIKQIASAQAFFWSVYPTWRLKAIDDHSKRKLFYYGDLEED